MNELTAAYIRGHLIAKKHPVGAVVAVHHLERDIRAVGAGFTQEQFNAGLAEGISQGFWREAVHPGTGAPAIERLS